MADDARSDEAMKKHQIVRYAIMGFNAWVMQEHVKKLQLKVNETFPRFVNPQPTELAA